MLVLYKLHLDGSGSLNLSYGKFLCLCIMAGCDYLPNVPGIGMHRAKQMIDSSDDFQSVLEKLREFLASNSY